MVCYWSDTNVATCDLVPIVFCSPQTDRTCSQGQVDMPVVSIEPLSFPTSRSVLRDFHQQIFPQPRQFYQLAPLHRWPLTILFVDWHGCTSQLAEKLVLPRLLNALITCRVPGCRVHIFSMSVFIPIYHPGKTYSPWPTQAS